MLKAPTRDTPLIMEGSNYNYSAQHNRYRAVYQPKGEKRMYQQYNRATNFNSTSIYSIFMAIILSNIQSSTYVTIHIKHKTPYQSSTSIICNTSLSNVVSYKCHHASLGLIDVVHIQYSNSSERHLRLPLGLTGRSYNVK